MPWGSLSESRNTNSTEIVARPLGPGHKAGTGREGVRFRGDCLPGLSQDEFQDQTAVPWNEIGLCGLLKETPTALPTLFSKH